MIFMRTNSSRRAGGRYHGFLPASWRNYNDLGPLAKGCLFCFSELRVSHRKIIRFSHLPIPLGPAVFELDLIGRHWPGTGLPSGNAPWVALINLVLICLITSFQNDPQWLNMIKIGMVHVNRTLRSIPDFFAERYRKLQIWVVYRKFRRRRMECSYLSYG
jgi:hypothetical protein